MNMRKVIEIGGALYINIPQVHAKQQEVEKGDIMIVTAVGGQIAYAKYKKRD